MKKRVIAYVHTHWDREWYREYEVFRMRLLRVFDNVLEMLADGKIPSFYFDGQVAAILDYLEIRPEKESLVRKLIFEKKLFIGPFYCLVDEFLTDESCFRKNLELGLKISKEFGCSDFVGYFADTFGHSPATLPLLKEYGIDTVVVWRGCGDIPAEFSWNGVDAINLVRGYFQDVFSTPFCIEKKAEILKDSLDKISEKSGDTLLLPIGADHLGVEVDLYNQISEVNELLDDYDIKLGSLFEYIDAVKNNFKLFNVSGELRDNSKTFILEGSYSSRTDIKRYNVVASHKLELADSLVRYYDDEKYFSLIEYAYKMLIQNQAHDSICGCSTDDVHSENITRYKKIIQIADNIVEDVRFKNGYKFNKVLNLSKQPYTGCLEFKSSDKYPYQILYKEQGFSQKILQDTQKIPVTEDYSGIYNYVLSVNNVNYGEQTLVPFNDVTDVFVTENCIGNSNIFLIVENGEIRVGDKILKLVDYADNGDSYNTGYVKDDEGVFGEIVYTKIIREGEVRSTLGVGISICGELVDVEISLDKYSSHLDFVFNWNNTRSNHLLELVADTLRPLDVVYSEDFNKIIKREFDSDYDVRKNLPTEKGKEVKANNAPMQRGVCANGIGFVTKGLNQYEVFNTELRIPILRSVGIISNPENPSRTTPAGPPIPVSDLRQLGDNRVELSVFLGNDLQKQISAIYNKCIII